MGYHSNLDIDYPVRRSPSAARQAAEDAAVQAMLAESAAELRRLAEDASLMALAEAGALAFDEGFDPQLDAAPLPFAGNDLPPLRPSVVAAAAMALAEEYADAASAARTRGELEAATDLGRAASAARKAAYHAETIAWRWAGDVLLVPSATIGGTVYAVHRSGCHCPAAENGRPCFHSALRAAYERAEDELEREVLTTLAA